jgi:hypothetical protein
VVDKRATGTQPGVAKPQSMRQWAACRVRRKNWGRTMKPVFSSAALPVIERIAAMEEAESGAPLFGLFSRPDIYARRIQIAPLVPPIEMRPYPYKRDDESVN